jgi:type IV pilus assembly protein PilV
MTLIEVMVATVIIAIGLLGVALLQVSALQGASNADYRSRAIDFASALSDRMHANLAAFDHDDTDNDNAYTSAAAVDCDVTPSQICEMSPNSNDTTNVNECDPSDAAKFDLWKITCGNSKQGGVQNSLPGGRLALECLDKVSDDSDACSDLSPILITITWDLQSDDNATDKVIMTVVPGAP